MPLTVGGSSRLNPQWRIISQETKGIIARISGEIATLLALLALQISAWVQQYVQKKYLWVRGVIVLELLKSRSNVHSRSTRVFCVQHCEACSGCDWRLMPPLVKLSAVTSRGLSGGIGASLVAVLAPSKLAPCAVI